MKPTLQLKLSQHLTLTPQLQQSIRLLQLSTLELNQEIERMVQENPLLEMMDPAGSDSQEYRDIPGRNGPELLSDTAPVSSGESGSNETVAAGEDVRPENGPDEATDWLTGNSDFRHARDDEDFEYPQQAEPVSLREHLLWQTSLSQMMDRDRRIVSLLIDSLNDDGYLIQDLEELAGFLPPELEIGMDDLHIALEHLQHLDPPGVGARNLGECLLMQLRALPEDTPYRDQAMLLVKDYLDVLAARDFSRIKKLLHCDDQALRAIQHLITGLNPRPGAAFSTTVARYIVPDVIVSKVSGNWVVNLNPESIPRLRVNHVYADMLKNSHDEAGRRLTGQLHEARWLIKNVRQRFDTILRVSGAIVERQRQFFEHGPVAMRPLVLREIADILDLHESTVSRVTTQKFMRTPRGTFELKYFFGSHVATDTGGACSATAIRALIKQLIDNENTRKPLSDSKITEVLGQQGIVVARRTIAKYRESMQIPPVSLRKSL